MWRKRWATPVWIAEAIGFLWALVQSIRSEGPKMISQIELPPELIEGFYVFAVVLGISAIARIHWDWFQSLRPSNRFYNLAEEARWLYRRFEGIRLSRTGEPLLDAETWEKMSIIIHKLDRLGIKHPDEVKCSSHFYRWLPSLAAWAETKNIKEARRYKYEPAKETSGSEEAS